MIQLLSPKMQGALRHLLTSFGPLLSMNGITSEADWQVAVGIIMAAFGFLWSWFSPEKKV